MDQDRTMKRLPFPVYRVGGSVRDELLGRTPKDADYVAITEISGLEKGLRRLTGKKPSPLELRNGTVVGYRVPIDGSLVEVCVPRAEFSTGPGHGDFRIEASKFVPLEKDARRRDFTINALYRDLRTGRVLDPTGYGRYDLERGFIRILSKDSFQEDPLRCLRAFRFMSQLGFVLSPSTEEAMREQARYVVGLTRNGNMSGTALDELRKLLMGREPLIALRAMRDTGVFAAFLPELEPMIGFEQESKYHDMTVDEHTFHAIQIAANLRASERVRFALLFHDAGKPECSWRGSDGRLHYFEPGLDVVCKLWDDPRSGVDEPTWPRAHEEVSGDIADATLIRLGAPRRLREDVVRMVRGHMLASLSAKPTRMRKLRCEYGHEFARDLLVHVYCDCRAKTEYDNVTINKVRDMLAAVDAADEQGVPTSRGDLAIKGGELKQFGVEGKAIGWVLDQLLHEVVCQPKLNDREWLLRRAAKLAREADGMVCT